MKVLKLEFKPEVTEHRHGEYPLASDLDEVFFSYNLNNLQELHLIGVDIGLDESDFKARL